MKFTSRTKPGYGRGKEIGLPTVNLEIPEDFKLEYGIYAAWVLSIQGPLMALVHYGPVPTFDQNLPSLEVHVIEPFHLEDVAEELTVEIISYVRAIRQFEEVQGLLNQIVLDREQALSVLENNAEDF